MQRLAIFLATALALAARAAWAGSLALPPGAGAGMYAPGAGSAAAALPMTSSKVDVDVRGPIATVSVEQTFRNDAAVPTEATYIFPMPADAAVSAMAIEVGARTIRASVERRVQAQARYEAAIAKGVDAALLEQERPDVFTQTVAAIPPHAAVTVHFRFDTAARYADGTWELALPLVVAPRFAPGSASGRPTVGSGRSPDTDRAPDASRVTPATAPGDGGATEIALAFESGVEGVASPTHDLEPVSPAQPGAGGARYRIVDPKSDRDAVVRWRASAPTHGWVEIDGTTGFAAVVVEAPPRPATRGPVRATFVFDRAATTLGDGALVEHALEVAFTGALGPGDYAATERTAFAPAERLGAVLASAPAHRAFDLTRVLARLKASQSPIVLVTDGLVADDSAAIRAARALGVPVHVVGFGPAPNRSLLAAIAAASGGTVRVALVGDDVAALARDVLADVATPPAPLAVTWGALAASAIVPALQPRLGAGQAVLVVARVAKPVASNARAAGSVLALAAFAAPVAPPGATTPNGPLARRWARLELDELVANGDRAAIAAHALAYGLVSPETSLVAIGEEVSTAGGVRHTRAVPVALPAGMRWREVERETTVESEPPQKAKRAKDTAKTDDEREDDDDARKSERAHHKALEPTSGAPAPAPEESAGAPPGESRDLIDIFGPGAASHLNAEVSDVAVQSAPGVLAQRRAARFAIALGGGIAVARGDAVGMGAITARVDIGRLTRFGVEGALWLVDGLHAQGEVGLYVSRVGLGSHFELGGGPALHLGGGVGPALDLALRFFVPGHAHIGLYLRQDAGLLFESGAHAAQSTTSAGVETDW